MFRMFSLGPSAAVASQSREPSDGETTEEEEGFSAGMRTLPPTRYGSGGFGAVAAEDDASASVEGSTEEADDEESEGFPLLDFLGDNHNSRVCQGVCCFVCCIVILLLATMKGLPATEYALTRNIITSSIDYSTHYHGGRHFIPMQEYIRFPATVQTIEWSYKSDKALGGGATESAPMKVRTASGIMVDLGMAVQYHIVEEHIGAMYADFKDMIAQNFVSQLRAGFNDLIQQHPTEALWKDRLNMQTWLLAKCTSIAQHEMKNYVKCWNLQLHNVWIPANVESAMIAKQVQEQFAKLEGQRQMATLIRAQTDVIAATYEKNIKVVNATAEANAYRKTQTAKSEAGHRWRLKRAEALTKAKSQLPLDGDGMLSYQEKVAIIDAKSADLVYGAFSVISRQEM